MTGRERFLAALRREQPDQVPIWELIINEPTISGIYGPVGYYEFAERIGLDAVTVFETHRREESGNGLFKDEWGIKWQIEPCGVAYPAGGPIRDKSDLDHYRTPDPHAEHRLESVRDAVGHFKGEKAVVLCCHEGFEFSHYLYGMDNLLISYVEDPDFAHRLTRMIVDYKKAVMLDAIEAGVDVIVSGDDYAFRTAPLMSPDLFREFSAPYIQELAKTAHSRGVPFVKHTDGYIWPILDMIVDAGVDGIDPIEPIAGMDIGEVKAEYGDRLAVVGNVDCTEILTHGSKEDIVDAVKETIAKGAVGGGHILASSNSIHPGVSPEGYLTMVQAAQHFGQYPLDDGMVLEYKERDYISKYIGV